MRPYFLFHSITLDFHQLRHLMDFVSFPYYIIVIFHNFVF